MSSDLVEIHYIDGPLLGSVERRDKDSFKSCGGVLHVAIPVKSTLVTSEASNFSGTAKCHIYEYRCILLPPSRYLGMPDRYAAFLI